MTILILSFILFLILLAAVFAWRAVDKVERNFIAPVSGTYLLSGEVSPNLAPVMVSLQKVGTGVSDLAQSAARLAPVMLAFSRALDKFPPLEDLDEE